MLHILLLILKILGIILLIILLLFLVGLYSLFFAPVGWKLYTKREETIQVSLRVGWLFRIVTVRYSLDQAKDWEQDISIRFLGIPVTKFFNRKNLRGLWRRRRRRRSSPPADVKSPSPVSAKLPEPTPNASLEPQLSDFPKPEPAPEAEENIYEDIQPKRKSPKKKKSFRFVWTSVRSHIRKFLVWLKRLKKALLNIKSTFHRMKEKKDKFLDFWRLEEHKNARNTIKKELQFLWNKSKPRKIKGMVTFGFDDPSYTGLCMGAASMLYAWYPKKLRIIPDFEQEIFQWDLCAKGKFRGYMPIRVLWKIFTDEEIRRMYERWENL